MPTKRATKRKLLQVHHRPVTLRCGVGYLCARCGRECYMRGERMMHRMPKRGPMRRKLELKPAKNRGAK